VLEPTSTYVVDSLALRYQHMHHSTAPAELMIPVTAHLELVDELASTAPSGPQRQQVLRNHSQLALLAGRLSFFDLHDPGAARAYYGMSLDSAREAGDPHLEAVTLGHMSFVAASSRSFRAAIDLLEGANKHASGSTIVPSWLAAVESEVGLAAAALVAWRLRVRPSEQVAAWQRGAQGERRTARLLDRLVRDGYVIFHDLAVPDSGANVDHLVIGPSGVFVIDSKQWTGSVQQGSDGLAWHNHYRLDRTLETVRWEAQIIGRLLGTRAAAVVCVHGAHVHGGGLEVQGVAIVAAHLLRSAFGDDRVLSDAEVALLATTAWARLRPAA
jgi:hypothetical protein